MPVLYIFLLVQSVKKTVDGGLRYIVLEGGRGGGVARNELRCGSRKRVFDSSAQLGFSNDTASCTNLTRVHAPSLLVS